MVRPVAKTSNELSWERLFLQELHRIYEIALPNLNSKGVAELIEWLCDKGVNRDDARLIAESTSCEYFHRLNEPEDGIRNADLLKDMEEIRKAAEQLQQVLKTAKLQSLSELRSKLLRREEPEEGRKPGILYFTKLTKRSIASISLLEPPALMALGDLARVADEVLTHTPVDRGGRGSGSYGSVQKRAVEEMVLRARFVLGALGLPVGLSRGGDVAQFIQHVHKATTGEEKSPSWADKHATAIPEDNYFCIP